MHTYIYIYIGKYSGEMTYNGIIAPYTSRSFGSIKTFQFSPSSHRLYLNHHEPSSLVSRHLTRKIKEQFVFNSKPGFSPNSFQTSYTCLLYVSTILKTDTFCKFCLIFVIVHSYRYCTILFVF